MVAGVGSVMVGATRRTRFLRSWMIMNNRKQRQWQAWVLAAVVAGGGGCWAQTMGTAGPAVPTSTAGCCGQQMTLVGQANIYTVEGGKARDGSAVAEGLRTEVYGEELVARAEVAAGTYTVVV